MLFCGGEVPMIGQKIMFPEEQEQSSGQLLFCVVSTLAHRMVTKYNGLN